MRYGSYEFTIVFDSSALLPPFKGSTFRGAFGAALKRVTCALRWQDCDRCLLQDTCVYRRVFEAKAGSGSDPQTSTHPFVLEPPPTSRSTFETGEAISCRLLLFGWANDTLPYFVYAVQQMGERGLGRRGDGRRGTFHLAAVTSGGETVYDVSDGSLRPPSSLAELVLEPRGPSDSEIKEISLEIETPLRIKHENRLHADLPFHILVRAMLRRISVLSKHFGDGEPPLDYRGLVTRAADVHTVASSIRWLDWKRYSNRQDQAMLMGGIVGSATYGGRLGEFMPLLRYCEKVHVGKATTFGLGKITIAGRSAKDA